MKHQWTVLFVGFILMALPFLGFPQSFDYTVMFLAGLFFFVRSLLALKHHYGSEADAHVPVVKENPQVLPADQQSGGDTPVQTVG